MCICVRYREKKGRGGSIPSNEQRERERGGGEGRKVGRLMSRERRGGGGVVYGVMSRERERERERERGGGEATVKFLW